MIDMKPSRRGDCRTHQLPHSTPPDYFGLSLEHAWTRYVGLPVSRPRDRFLHGKWDRDLAHNSEYDVAKTLELVLYYL
jgi:hypothetical protein